MASCDDVPVSRNRASLGSVLARRKAKIEIPGSCFEGFGLDKVEQLCEERQHHHHRCWGSENSKKLLLPTHQDSTCGEARRSPEGSPAFSGSLTRTSASEDGRCDPAGTGSEGLEERQSTEDAQVDIDVGLAAEEEEYSEESGSDDRGEEDSAQDEYDEYSDEYSSQGSDAEGREAKPRRACDDACDEYSGSEGYSHEEEEEDVKVHAAADEEEYSDESGSDDRGEEVTAPEEDEEGDEYDEYSDEYSSQGSADVEGSEEELSEDCSGSEYSYEEEEEEDVSEADVPPDAGKAGSLHNKECDGAQEVGSAEGRQNNADDSEIAIHELENDTAGGSKQGKAVDEAADAGEAACVDGDAVEHVPEAEDEADDAAEADQSGSGALQDDSQILLREAEDADPEGDTPGGAKQGKAVDEAADAGEAACVDGDAGEHVPEAKDEAADDAAGADQSESGALQDHSQIPLHEAEDADPEGDTPGDAKQGKAVDEAADAGDAACVDGDAAEHVPEAEDEAADDAADQSGSLHEAEDADPEGDTPGSAKQSKAVDAGEAAGVDGDAGEHVPEAEDEAADDAAEADQSGSGALKDDSQIPLHEAEDAEAGEGVEAREDEGDGEHLEAEEKEEVGEECRSDAEAIEVSDAVEEDPHSTCLGVADIIVSALKSPDLRLDVSRTSQQTPTMSSLRRMPFRLSQPGAKRSIFKTLSQQPGVSRSDAEVGEDVDESHGPAEAENVRYSI